mmetsp:Transcript_34225/g.78106  ORF Transcript_34225/g.78106 Transcript_34225/m.78106 type:complete len:170 (+) Transcript_34225:70-579(+)
MAETRTGSDSWLEASALRRVEEKERLEDSKAMERQRRGSLSTTWETSSTAIREYYRQVDATELSKHIKARFVVWDADSSGALDKRELTEAMSAMGHRPSAEEVDKLFAEFDKDGSGTVECDEFEHMVREAMGFHLDQCECRMCDGARKAAAAQVASEGNAAHSPQDVIG